MEAILAIIAIIIVIYIIVYVVLPIASVLAAVTLVVSAGYALIVSLISFVSSLKKNINPYATYKDNQANNVAGMKRNYCFGPGFHQISETVKDAFENLSDYRSGLTGWKNKVIRHRWMIDIWIYLGYGFAIFCEQILGFVWVSAFSIVMSTTIIVGMTVFFLFFSILWIADRIVLFANSIHNRCPNCKRKSVVPIFVCPTCGIEHRNLVPGPYGVMKRKCICGTKLSTTFIGGRSRYEARCPFCGNELFTSSSQQYGIQLVGGIGAGKTTFLAAFWHEYREWLIQLQDVSYKETPLEAFEELENWFQSGRTEATLEINASMYSIIHLLNKNRSVQMTIYDIAGEAFDFVDSGTQQQQFNYCEGLIIVIDPTATPEYVSGTITNFINDLDEIKGKHSSKKANVPVAVIITQGDLYKREIGLPRIRASFKTSENTGINTGSLEQHQNEVCRTFLLDHGYTNALNLLEAEFSHIRYFPVSAMGHDVEEGQYEPWGVLEPVLWLMGNENCPLCNIILRQKYSNK